MELRPLSSNILKLTQPFRRSSLLPTQCSVLSRGNHTSASEKLFADAAREEAEGSNPHKSSRLTVLENEHQNWDGEERIQDTVLRMLIDKYKPLRTGTIQSADQKLKLAPPRVRPASQGQVVVAPLTPSTGSWATEPLLPSKQGHQPWHTQFKAPAHATSSIKHASFPLPPPRPSAAAAKPVPVDDRARRKEREEKKRAERAGRLATARESTLDYRFGIRGGSEAPRSPVNPVSLKGWTNLVEEKIEKARQAGLFQTVKGRGKPLVTATEESNPFIAREEFLMNRIIQRQGAAPPWVQLQSELDTAVNSFRELLRQSWIRRAVRMLTLSTPPGLLHTFKLSDVRSFRDPEWEQRERSYHQVALEDLNALVRKYNGLAPYAVRRPYYMHNVEMDRLYEESAEEILRELGERARAPDVEMKIWTASEGPTSSAGAGATGEGLTRPTVHWLKRYYDPTIYLS
ncbi:putative protein with domain of unknown function (DUF1992) [Lyophyllum shimeji]|uniref:DnaJ homologue subfamily C member 28 conserved domain-containing protein n=1 Tax=Lyophyllum shimeji TaxID=47721 RepID=A0A9P3UKB3_LYOSH|nr:putative protein with domain of unknown function (DUF1992) [Lyophyllum shimeji]